MGHAYVFRLSVLTGGLGPWLIFGISFFFFFGHLPIRELRFFDCFACAGGILQPSKSFEKQHISSVLPCNREYSYPDSQNSRSHGPVFIPIPRLIRSLVFRTFIKSLARSPIRGTICTAGAIMRPRSTNPLSGCPTRVRTGGDHSGAFCLTIRHFHRARIRPKAYNCG